MRTRKYKEPSRASLKAMPVIDFDPARFSANRFAGRMEKPIVIRVGKGRPEKGSEGGPSTTRSIRFPEREWERLEKYAKEAGLTLHAALRTAVALWATRMHSR
jgi:hypothetical protein